MADEGKILITFEVELYLEKDNTIESDMEFLDEIEDMALGLKHALNNNMKLKSSETFLRDVKSFILHYSHGSWRSGKRIGPQKDIIELKKEYEDDCPIPLKFKSLDEVTLELAEAEESYKRKQ